MKNPIRNGLLAIAIVGVGAWAVIDRAGDDSRERGSIIRITHDAERRIQEELGKRRDRPSRRLDGRITVDGGADPVRQFVERQQEAHGDLEVVETSYVSGRGRAVLRFDGDDAEELTGSAKAAGLTFSATIG